MMMPITTNPPGPDGWASAWADPTTLGCAAAVLLSVFVLWLIGRMIRSIGRIGSLLPQRSGVDGTATMEFALVAPIAMFFVLLLAQVTFLMAGNVFVHYAAFVATRTASLEIPRNYTDGGPNQYTHAAGFTKHDAIHRAAVFAAAPIGGAMPDNPAGAPDQAYVGALQSYYENMGCNAPRWVSNMMDDRLRYVAAATQIDVWLTEVDSTVDPPVVVFTRLDDGERHVFEPREPITVSVTHQYFLSVPYVNRLMAGIGEGSSSRPTWRIYAQSTMTNMGIRPDLPPAPPVPRG